MKNFDRYERNPVLDFPGREWPGKVALCAPKWCSVDLRDGNQALIEPMNVEEKTELFRLLLEIGFRDIEVGFPAASSIEYEFVRRLAEEENVPDDCRIQLLMQCSEEQIRTSFEAAKGLKKVIMHIYNPTSVLQRDVVFHMDREQILQIAVNAAKIVKECAERFDGNIIFEYSPESFSGTEPEYAVRVIDAVLDVWQPGPERKAIINLPETMELNTPNVYADQVEWVAKHMKYREFAELSVHTHNDRGTGIAASELALLAGADRVEGTLFGNGERTGNADLLTIAYNLYAQGIDPGLNLENIHAISEAYQRLVKMPISPRHPYAGDLAFTAFSGGHQDAVRKGFQAMRERGGNRWLVPYLLIDPTDIGRFYEPIVRINSQSGKGGVAFVMEREHGFKLPKEMHREFAHAVQLFAEQKGGEVTPEEMLEVFRGEYLRRKSPLHFLRCNVDDRSDDETQVTHALLKFEYNGKTYTRECEGNGPIDAVKKGLQDFLGIQIKLLDYTEHALTTGSEAQAAAYVSMTNRETGDSTFGVGISSNITRASIRAVFCAVNRLISMEKAGKEGV